MSVTVNKRPDYLILQEDVTTVVKNIDLTDGKFEYTGFGGNLSIKAGYDKVSISNLTTGETLYVCFHPNIEVNPSNKHGVVPIPGGGTFDADFAVSWISLVGTGNCEAFIFLSND